MRNIDIYNNLTELLKTKASEILPKGSRLALYGSRARGDARDDSDWDLHILIPGEEQLPITKWDEYAWPFELIGLQLGELVNARIYSFSGWLKRNFLPFYANVEQDKVILYQSGLVMTLPSPRRNDIIAYRIEKSVQTLQEAKDVAKMGYWSLAANRLYYAAYYASVALLINNEITANTHKGAVRMIGYKFVNEGILPTSDAQLLSKLFSMRQSGDYDDLFDWKQKDVEPLIPQVEGYMQRIFNIINLGAH